MRNSCLFCRFLDKSQFKPSENGDAHKLFGCNIEGRGGFVCGWAEGDKDLKWQGCSGFEEPLKNQQITFFEEKPK